MAKATKKPASRGFVNNIILESLLTGDKYGYEIIKEVEEKSEGKIQLKQPSLYSSLKRFEAKGLITSYWGDSDIGGRRHYYTLTENGKNYFGKNGATNPKFSANLNEVVLEEEELDNISIDEMVEPIQEKIIEPEQPKQDKQIMSEPTVKNQSATKVSSNYYVENIDTDSPDYDIFNILDNEDSEDEQLQKVENNEDIYNNQVSEIAPQEDDLLLEKQKELQESVVEVKNILLNREPVTKDKEPKVTMSRVLYTTPHNITSKPSAIQNDMFSNNSPNFELAEKQSLDNEKVRELKDLKRVQYFKLQSEQKEDGQEKNIPLIKEQEEEYLEWEDKKRKTVALNKLYNETEDEANGQEYFEEQENDQEDMSYYTQTVEEEVELIDGQIELDIELEQTEPVAIVAEEEQIIVNKKPSIVVDEFGIKRSATDVLEKRQIKTFDNVGARLETKDPISPKHATAPQNDKKTNNVESNVAQDKMVDYEERERQLEEKLQNAVRNKKPSRTDSINFKNILGELLITDEELDELENTSAKQIHMDEALVDIAPFKEEESIYAPIKTNNTSLTALEDSLKVDGYKLKPYSYDLNTGKSSNEFVLYNKLKLYFGIIIFILSALQTTAFLIGVTYIPYALKVFDYVIVGFAYAVPTALLILVTISYFYNSNKRRKIAYNFNSSMLYATLVFFSIVIITYAFNSFFGMQLKNIEPYTVTLFLPIILALNIVLGPVVYKVLLSNNKFY